VICRIPVVFQRSRASLPDAWRGAHTDAGPQRSLNRRYEPGTVSGLIQQVLLTSFNRQAAALSWYLYTQTLIGEWRAIDGVAARNIQRSVR